MTRPLCLVLLRSAMRDPIQYGLSGYFRILVLSGLVLVCSCGRKAPGIDQMVSSRNINGLSGVIVSESETPARRLQAAHALVQLDLANRLMQNIENLAPKNPDAARELVGALASELPEKMVDDSPPSVSARDALVTIYPRLNPEDQKRVADAVLKWMADRMETRADAGNFKLIRILEIVGNQTSETVLIEVAKAHATFMLSDFPTHGDDGVLIHRRAHPDAHDLKPTANTSFYQRYWKHFRKSVFDAAIERYSITDPGEKQIQDLGILKDYGQGEDAKRAGKKILDDMKTSQKATITSVLAMGELSPPGATEYLSIFVRPNIEKNLRDAAYKALIAIQDDAAATSLLYELAKPLLEALNRRTITDEDQQPWNLMALKGLMFLRDCEIDPAEYRLVRDVSRVKLDGQLFELRNTFMPAIHRIMLCTGKAQGYRDIQASMRFPMPLDSVLLMVQVLNTLDMDALLPLLREDLGSKRTEVVTLAVLALGQYGVKDDILLLEGIKNNQTAVSDWGRTLGDLAADSQDKLRKKHQAD